MEIEEGVRPRRITPSKISIILHMIRKPNSIIVLLFIQKNSKFKNIATLAKTCLPPSMLRPNLVISYLVMVNYACAFSQLESGKYFE